ncbi:MAG: hypothetical protein CK532_00765 [Flavobacteriales bacterium]|nr:MAG: hypothetical protein CK532_00765 [Flavobacteriales bacterium]
MKPEVFYFTSLHMYGYGFYILLGVIFAHSHLWVNRKQLTMDTEGIGAIMLRKKNTITIP